MKHSGRLGPILAVALIPLGAAQRSDAQVRQGQGLEATGEEALPAPEAFGLVTGRPRVTPTRTDTPPVIDGRLDDEVWKTAAHITEFTQQQPLDGAPATEETDVYIAYDAEHLYFGFHAHYEDPSIMRANRGERDSMWQDDLITVYFDTFLDQQRGYDFDVNGYGVQGDGVMTAGGRGDRGGGMAIPPADRSWDALFDTGAQIVEDGFTAEMAIPFKSLRYPSPPDGEPHRWGFQIVREVKDKDWENQVWAPMSRDETSFFAQMGLLEGMTDLSTSRNLEVLPTFTAIQYGEIDPTRPGGPAFHNRATDPDAGVNVKYGITSNLTADFTVNPDFSQIESDQPQIEVNQRFPLFFQELRPFFVEGSEIFNVFSPVTLVHTRTIVDPDWGAKLTGQVGPLALGVLTANDRAPGKVDDPNDPAFDHTAKNFIARARYELYAESNLGAFFTDREFRDGYSRLLGADGSFRLSPTINANFNVIGTRRRLPGDQEVAGHLLGAFASQNARNLRWSVGAFEISPDFETDVGFVRRRDQRQVQGNVGYRFWPENWIIDWGPAVSYSRNYDFDDTLQDENLGLGLNFTFANNITVGGGYDVDMERWQGIDFETTGFSVRTRFNTNRRYSFGGSFSMREQIFYAGPFLGDQLNWNVNGTIRPTDAWETTLRFDHRRLTDPANGGAELFDVRIIRAQSNFQFTERLGLRNITEFNTQDETFDLNLLLNYRVNAGTVVYLGYDDHYQQADLIEGDTDGDGFLEQLYYTQGLKRTNRAIFLKFQYLFRY